MNNYLLIDFGSTFTKLTAVNLDREEIIATSNAFTTVETDINEGYTIALNSLFEKIGKRIEFKKTIACSSAAGGLKMAAIGLVEELTTEAAKRVCLGSGAKVEMVLSYKITNTELNTLLSKDIDIILLAGGSDGGNSETVIYNALQLAKSPIKCPIIFAGNKVASDEIIKAFEEHNKDYYICENVMPKLNQLNIESAQEKIKEIFVKNIVEAKGIKKIEESIDEVILPTPTAVLTAAELLSKGFGDESGIGEIILVDVGGATTDIYSIAEGLPKSTNTVLAGLEEPFAKRTVEGDLGMRYSAIGISDALSASELAHYNNKGIDLVAEAKQRRGNVDFIPVDKKDRDVDVLLAHKCVDISFSRHVGTIKEVYTHFGNMYYQLGKDLTDTSYIVGTGGVIVNNQNPKEILAGVEMTLQKPTELRPKNPKYLIDNSYILASMGLLSIDYPEIALRIMKRKIREIGEDNK